MTTVSATKYLKQWVRDKEAELRRNIGVVVYPDSIFLTRRVHPCAIGLRLEVEIPEQLKEITQKIEDFVQNYATILSLKKDPSGREYFYEDKRYRFWTSGHEHEKYGWYRYVLVREEPAAQPHTDAPPAPQPSIGSIPTAETQEPPIEQPPETANPAAFQNAQRCPIRQFFARIWACVSQAFAKLARCLCCRGKKA